MSGLAKLLKDEGETRTAKQVLVDIRKSGAIGDRQLRGLAQALDLLLQRNRKLDPHKALRVVLESYDSGELTTASGGAVPKVERPKLADVPGHLTPKEKLLWLHEQGSISKQQLLSGARVISQHEREGRQIVIESVLISAGATEVLPDELRAKAETRQKKAEKPTKPEAGSGEAENPAGAGAPSAPAGDSVDGAGVEPQNGENGDPAALEPVDPDEDEELTEEEVRAGLAGVDFASDEAAELAIHHQLDRDDFAGRTPTGKTGFTKGDVEALIETITADGGDALDEIEL